MTIREAIEHLVRNTNWNMGGIAFVIGVPIEKVFQVISEGKIRRRKHAE